jgi:hypothetical protein
VEEPLSTPTSGRATLNTHFWKSHSQHRLVEEPLSTPACGRATLNTGFWKSHSQHRLVEEPLSTPASGRATLNTGLWNSHSQHPLLQVRQDVCIKALNIYIKNFFLEKLTVAQLLVKFLALYGALIIVYTGPLS